MGTRIRVAAAGDIHAGAGERDRVREAFRRVEEQADLILLAGDLTRHGQVDEVCVVADACRDLDVPSSRCSATTTGTRTGRTTSAARWGGGRCDARPVAHDSAGRRSQRRRRRCEGVRRWLREQWANFGEPLFREAYGETTREVDGLERGLRAIEACSVRIALLHYSPAEATLEASPTALARAWCRPARRPDPPAPAGPRGCTATRTMGRSKARSTAFRSTTSQCT